MDIEIDGKLELEIKNAHERDQNIVFDEEPHIYYINGSNDNISITTFIHKMFPEFDADNVIDKMMIGKNWKNSKYYGMTKDEIKKQWDDNRISSSTAGTKMHRDIELFYNNIPVNNDSIEYRYFNNFLNDYPNLKAYRTEWIVYDKKYKFAGSIDMVFVNENDELLIYDWKRCKNITKENGFENGYPPVDHLPHSNFWHYSLQLNMYKMILEKNYNKKIIGLFLLCLHPDNSNYLRFEVPELRTEVKALFRHRLEMV